MKIYVSDKEIKENNLVNNNSKEVVLTTYSWDLDDNQFKDEYPLKIISLEQHDKEIRKPLEDEIVSLKKYISQLEYWKSYWYNSYDEIRNKYNKNQQVKQERQKVIAELEEWINKDNEFITRTYISPFREEKIPIVFKEDLQQKLNEMKGEKDE